MTLCAHSAWVSRLCEAELAFDVNSVLRSTVIDCGVPAHTMARSSASAKSVPLKDNARLYIVRVD